MKNSLKRNHLALNSNQGFTLVELMIVVAIIGILSAIAVPNFRKYQAKSKTSEAKIQLSAAYTGMVSFHADFETYHTCLRYMGFNPENEKDERFYAVGFPKIDTSAEDTIAASFGASVGAAAATNGCITGNDYADGEHYFLAGKKVGSTEAIDTVGKFEANDATKATMIGEDEFELAAVGVIDKKYETGEKASGFTISHNKLIKNHTPGY